MTVSAAPQTYHSMIAYGLKKVALRLDQLFLQGVAAGFWVGLFGHLCTVLASPVYAQAGSGYAALAYAAFFPGAFIAIIVTGSELFTGNTVTMTLCLLDRRATFLQCLRVWVVSFFGNYVGAVFTAGLSWLSGVFDKDAQTDAFLYLQYMTGKKTDYGFGAILVLGIGCNCMVCLALWAVVSTEDGAGKYIGLWFPIAAFAAGGYEHVVANMYTLTVGVFAGSEKLAGVGSLETIKYWEVLLWNLLPVLIGNLLAGTVFTGLLWWYNFHPQEGELYHITDGELLAEVDRRSSKKLSFSRKASKQGALAEDSDVESASQVQ